MQLFHFLITWRSSNSKSAAVYKISSKSDDFSLRYGDITIFKMAAVHHLGIVYHHTRPPTKSLSAACQISCQSDTQIWRYSYLNFSHIWLEMPTQAPKIEVLGGFGPVNVIIHHRYPQKAHHPCVNPRPVVKVSTVKIRWGVWPVGELTEIVTDTQTDRQINRHTGKFVFCPCIALDRQ